MIDLEFVRTYLDDILTITKLTLSDHLDKLRKVLTRLREAGFKLMPTNQNSVPMRRSILDISLQETELSHNRIRLRLSLHYNLPQMLKN
jgi:hypothetical protein